MKSIALKAESMKQLRISNEAKFVPYFSSNLYLMRTSTTLEREREKCEKDIDRNRDRRT